MKYRPLGNTGMLVSEIGMGCEGLNNKDEAYTREMFDYAIAQGEVPETVREHYASLKAHAGDCIGCGACEKRCPFKVKIIENMREAKETFGY